MEKMSLTEKTCRPLVVGILGAALCLPGLGATYTGGDCSAANLIHRWSFNGDFTDSVGGLAATGVQTSFADNAVHTTGGGKAASYVSLDPAALPKDRPFTIEIFATPKKIYSWSRIFSFGVGEPSSDPKNNLFMSWTRSTNQNQDEVRFRYGDGTNAIFADDSLQPFTVGTKWHIVLAYTPNVNGDGKGRFYWSKTDLHGGSHRESSATTVMAVDFSTWGMDGFYLGRSYWSADIDADADYDEVRIWDVAFTPEQTLWSARLGADTLPTAASAGAETATISFTAEAGGKVAFNGAAASPSGSPAVAKNELVTLVAVPDANYHFTGWSGDLWAIQSGTAADATITVYAASAASFAATFRQNTATWTGAGNNNLWSTAANWQDSLLPVEHAQLVFNGDVRTTSQNDLVAQLDKLTFGTGAAAQTLTGNGLELLALENLSAATQTVDLAVSSSAELPIANSGNLVFNQAVTVPTLTLTGSGTTIFNQQVASTAQNLDAGATMVFKGGLNGGTATDNLKGGTTYLNGTSTLGSLHLIKNGTTLTVDGADTTITTTGDFLGASRIAAGESTTINVNNGTVKVGTNFITDDSGGTGGGTAKAGGNGTINQTGGDVTVGNYFVVGRDHVGTYNLTGGTLTQTANNLDYVFLGEVGGSIGTMNISGDTRFASGLNLQVGRYGTGCLNISGGEVTLPGWLSIGRMATGVGTVNITGGKISQTGSGGLIVGELGKGTMNVSGDAVVDLKGPLSFSHSAANLSCEFNLTDGGTLKTSAIRLGNPTPFASMYVDDATLVANGSGATLDNFINIPCLSVGPKGMTLDTQNNTVILNRGFSVGSDGAAITKIGSGTLCMPASSFVPVKVQEGSLASLPATSGGEVDGNLAAHLLHRWSFNGDFTDSVGGLDATGVGTSFADNAVHTTGGGKAASYVSLDPASLPKDRPFTIEIFATPKAIHSWSRIFSFGKGAPNSDHLDNFFMSWTRGTEVKNDQVRLRYNGGTDAVVSNESLQPFTVGTKWHIVLTYVPNVTVDGKGRFFWSKTDLNGGNHREAFAITSKAVDLQTWGMDGFYLGRSYWTVDLDADADYDEVRIWDVALTSEQIIANAKLGPNVLPGAELVHRWSFNGDAKDSIGGTTALLVDAVTQGDKMVTTTGGTTGSGYVNLGNNMLPTDGSPVTIEIWATPHSRPNWSRVFDIGSNNGNYLTHAWSYQTMDNRDLVEIKKGGTAILSNQYTLFGYTLNTEYHYAFTITPTADGKATIAWARRDARTGALIKQGSGTTSAAWSVADIAGGPFYLGHSQYYPTDHNANASYNEVRVWKGALTDAQLSHSAALGPDVLPTESAGAIAAVELAAGTSFTAQSGEAAVGKLSGVGTVSGSVTVVDTLDVAGEGVGTMTLNGDLAVKGTWLLDMDGAACDLLTGTGTLDLSQATIAVRNPAKLQGSSLVATVGEVTGYKQATVSVKGYKLFYNDNRLTLASEGLFVFIR